MATKLCYNLKTKEFVIEPIPIDNVAIFKAVADKFKHKKIKDSTITGDGLYMLETEDNISEEEKTELKIIIDKKLK